VTVIALFTLTIFGLSAPKTAAMVDGFKHFVLLQRGHHTGILAPDVVASLIRMSAGNFRLLSRLLT